MTYDYINFSCTLSDLPGIYATLTDCENAVNDGSVKPVLILNPLWNASKKTALPLLINKFGDGYQQVTFQGVDQISEEWSITSPILIDTQVDNLLNQLRSLAATSFLWSPNNGVIDFKEFTCDQWKINRLGLNQYQISTTFKMSILGSRLLLPYTPTVTKDPYFSSVVFGSHFDSFTDVNGHGMTVNASSVSIDNTTKKFGGGSAKFTANQSTPITISDPNQDFSVSGNFTVDGWFNIANLGATAYLHVFFEVGTIGQQYFRCGWFNAAGGVLLFGTQNAAYNWTLPVTINTWYYFGFQRSSGIITAWANGNQLTRYGSSNPVNDTANIVSNISPVVGISRNSSEQCLNGWLDELRYTKAVRDLSIVPVAAFPNS